MQMFKAFKDGQESGPFTPEQIQELLTNKTLSPSDLVWSEGMESWTSIETIFDVQVIEEIVHIEVGEATEDRPPVFAPKGAVDSDDATVAPSPAPPVPYQPQSSEPPLAASPHPVPAPVPQEPVPAATTPPPPPAAPASNDLSLPSISLPTPNLDGTPDKGPNQSYALGQQGFKKAKLKEYRPVSFKTIFMLVACIIMAAALAGPLVLGFLIQGTSDAFTTQINEDPDSGVEIEHSDYERGYLSSHSSVLVRAPGSSGESLALKNTVYHGPIAVTGDGVKFVAAYHIFVLDRADWDSESNSKIRSYWGDAEPLEIHAAVGYSGESSVEVRLAPARGGQEGEKLVFGGGQIELMPRVDKNDYTKVEALIDIEGLTLEQGEVAKFSMEPIRGSLNFEQGRHLKVDLTLGEILSKNEETGNGFRVRQARLLVDTEARTPGSNLNLGSTVFSIPKLELEFAGTTLAVADAAWNFEMNESDDWLHGFSKIEVAGIELSDRAGPAGPAATLAPHVKDGLLMELGLKGISGEAMEQLSEKLSRLQTLIESVATDGEPAAENSSEVASASSDLLKHLVEIIQPGSQIYYDLNIGKGQAGLHLDLGMGGTLPLAQYGTLREILQSMTGHLRANLDPKLLEIPPIGAAIASPVQAGLGVVDETGFHLNGELRGGVAYVQEQPTPFLESLGPFLDTPIDWDAIFSVQQ